MKQTQLTDSPIYPSEPEIIEAEAHPIRADQIDQDARNVLQRFHKAGYAAYLVGGGVRDLYLGKAPKDFDISTDARPGQIRKLFRNSQTIGRRFRLVQVFFRGNKVVEVSTLRSLSEHDLDGPEAVLAPNNTFGTLDEDAQRRDLTINALFYSLSDNTIIDYVGGIRDLDHSMIRIVGDPDKRINRDPVRMLRAVRHAARINFSIEEKSWQSICRNHHTLRFCPPSRLRDELFKDLHSGSLFPWLILMLKSELFFDILSIYQGVLYSKGKEAEIGRDQLEKIVAVIDRVTLKVKSSSGALKLPNSLLLALILIPWAEIRFGLLGKERKGAQAFQLSKKIRSELDQEIGQQLNLRRSIRQEITTLLANLPLFVRHGPKEGWPKWLKKKSYFSRCSLFYHFYQEATGGEEVQDKELNLAPAPVEERRGRSGGKKRSRSRLRPAFSHGSKKGIFGLKK